MKQEKKETEICAIFKYGKEKGGTGRYNSSHNRRKFLIESNYKLKMFITQTYNFHRSKKHLKKFFTLETNLGPPGICIKSKVLLPEINWLPYPVRQRWDVNSRHVEPTFV